MNQSSPHEHPPLSAADLELLNAALDGELTAEQLTRLEARLADEPGLAQESAELQLIRTGLRELPMVTPPRSFTLASAPPRRGGWWRFNRLILMRTLAPAAIVMVIALLWPLFNPAPPAALVSLDATETPIVAAAAAPAAEGEAPAGMSLMAAPASAPPATTADAGAMMAAAAPAPEAAAAPAPEAAAAPAPEAVRMAPEAAAEPPSENAADVVDPYAGGGEILEKTAEPADTDGRTGIGINPVLAVVAAIALAAVVTGVVVWTQRRRQ